MAANSPSPNSSPTAVPPPPPTTNSPPPSNTSPPPSSTSPPPSNASPPPSEPNANPPDQSTPSTPSRPAQSPLLPPPPQNAHSPQLIPTPSPPPQQSNSPTPPSPSPPVSNPPTGSSPSPPPSPSNPSTSSPPPPQPVSNAPTSPPPTSSPATPSVPTKASPPPQTPSAPPNSSHPPPPRPSSVKPPESSSPPPPRTVPTEAPPPSQTPSAPPNSSHPPPPPRSSVKPPENSSPPAPPTVSPQSPPASPSSTPPTSSSPVPAVPPSNAAPPSNQTRSPAASGGAPSPSNSSAKSPALPPFVRLPPPPNDSRPSSPENSNPSGSGSINTIGLVAVGVTVGLIALTLIALAVWCLRKRRKEPSALNDVYVVPSPLASSSRSETSYTKSTASAPLIRSGGSGSEWVYSPKEPGGLGNSRSLYTYEELVKATDGFSAQNLLGEGGFGSVYKGYLPDGREVAIKQLKIGGGQGEREFKAEVEIISRVHHRHLVSLVGYCISENRRLLIYDYVPNNNLYFHLHGKGRPVLDWATRVKIAAGAARGIAYLHEDCHPRIIHRDIKSSNILLDNNFEAQVSDFGLAKLYLDADTHITTRVMGTFGYMAPEYASTGKLTEKSDVFSFGVVLLELITGRKPVDTSQPMGDEGLVEWARPLLSHALENEEFDGLADPKLGKDYVESEMFRMIEAAAACVRHLASKRPRMGQVVRAFDGLATSDLNNGMRVGESEVFNSAQQSEEIRWFQRMAFGSQSYSTDFFSQSSRDG